MNGTIKKDRPPIQLRKLSGISAAIMILIALALSMGGSFWAEAEPQISTAFEAWNEHSSYYPEADTNELASTSNGIRARFGVLTLCGDDARLPVEGYDIAPCKDGAAQLEAIIQSERILALYPDGFIEALEAQTGGIVLELCGGITPKDGARSPAPSAVTADCGSFRLVAIDVTSKTAGYDLMHELCHIIDAALDNASRENPSRWNAEDWEALNPEGFSYSLSYSEADPDPDIWTAASRDPGSVYFINSYSKTFPTEDRAVLFCALMRAGEGADFLKSPHVGRKLEYYFGAIRYYLAPEAGWDEEPFWERKLGAFP